MAKFIPRNASVPRIGTPNRGESWEKYLENGKPWSLAILHTTREPAAFMFVMMRYWEKS